MLTKEIMREEAKTVAVALDNFIATIIDKAADGDSAIAFVGELIAQGPSLYGGVESGFDDDANKARFGALVVAELGKLQAERHLPLTQGESVGPE